MAGKAIFVFMAVNFLWLCIFFPTVLFTSLLFHRVLGFSCMVLVLWSPVLLPLLPTLLQNLLSHNSSRIVELACVVGLYAAVTILIMQWGKGIRGYEYPLKQYGLDFTSPKKVSVNS